MSIEGAIELTNSRHEVFCNARANGASLEAAWRSASGAPLMAGATARSNGHRVSKRPEVQARIAYLQAHKAAQRAQGSLEKKTPIQWMQEVCAVLRDTAEAFNHLPLQKRSKLKSVYALHLARLHKMEEGSVTEAHEENNQPWKNIYPCMCQT